MRRGLGRTVGLAILIALLAGVYVLFVTGPAIPATAAQTPIARTVMTGDVLPDVENLNQPVPSPSGQECLDRITRDSGWVDLCWAAWRYQPETEDQQDTYFLKVYGSYQSTSALGIRWFVVKSRLVGQLYSGAFDGWPDGTYDGPCDEVPVSMGIPMTSTQNGPICGHTTSGKGSGWTWESDRTCRPCWPFDSTTRGFELDNVVGVAAGTVPAWDVYVDFGS